MHIHILRAHMPFLQLSSEDANRQLLVGAAVIPQLCLAYMASLYTVMPNMNGLGIWDSGASNRKNMEKMGNWFIGILAFRITVLDSLCFWYGMPQMGYSLNS